MCETERDRAGDLYISQSCHLQAHGIAVLIKSEVYKISSFDNVK